MAMSPARKNWRERLAGYPRLPLVKPIPAAIAKRRGEGTIAIPSPREVADAMRGVPQHRLTTVFGIGEAIAERHGATIGCTVTTAIFAHMVAHATEEQRADDGAAAAASLPWWRTLKIGGELNPKYPGGIDAQMERLQAEGHRVVQRGQRFFVEGYQDKLC